MLGTGRILFSWGFVFVLASGCAAKDEENSRAQSNLKFSHGNNLEDWQAPVEYQKSFGYFLSGFDEECRPSDMGNWDVKKYVLQGDESRKTLRKYIHQAIERMFESLKFNNSDCDTKPTEIIGILDANNFRYSQTASTQTLTFILDVLKDYVNIMLKHVHTAYFVNTNFVAQGFLLIARPILGEFMARVEVYGTRQSHWVPKLLKNIPSDQLPSKFGGSRNFKPLKTYG